MATSHISLGTIVDWFVQRTSGRAPAEQRASVLRVSKYNYFAFLFNAATVIATASVAVLIFASFHAALGVALVGVGLRLLANRDLKSFLEPIEEDHLIRILHHIGRMRNPEDFLFRRLGIERIEGWHMNRLYFSDIVLWKNSIPLRT